MASGLVGKNAMAQLRIKKREEAYKLSKLIQKKENERLATNADLGNWYRIYRNPSKEYVDGLNKAIARKMSRFGVI